MTKVESWLFAEGCSEIWLTTDIDVQLRAYSFYRNRGWTDWKIEKGNRYMKKRLARPVRVADLGRQASRNNHTDMRPSSQLIGTWKLISYETWTAVIPAIAR